MYHTHAPLGASNSGPVALSAQRGLDCDWSSDGGRPIRFNADSLTFECWYSRKSLLTANHKPVSVLFIVLTAECNRAECISSVIIRHPGMLILLQDVNRLKPRLM